MWVGHDTIVRVGLVIALAGVEAAAASARPEAIPAPVVAPDGAPRIEAPERTPVAPAPPSRGRLLCENHCMGCHESVVHVRDNRHARNVAELRAWVVRWVRHLGLPWGREEIDAVVYDLNDRYYGLPTR